MNADLRRQMGRMLAVGAGGFAVDAAVLQALILGAPMSPIPARALSFLAAVTFTWAFNRRFTFVAPQMHGRAQYLRYFLVSLAGFGINFVVFTFAVLGSSWLYTHPMVALLPAAASGLMVNFLGYRYWVFRSPPG